MTEESTAIMSAEADAPEQYRMSLGVEISTTGPCRKHVKVKVPESDLNYFRVEILKSFGSEAQVPGFRPGKVPQWLLLKQFKKEINDQVRQRVLLQSLDQLSEDNNLDPINEPNFDLETLTIPETGDFDYEFDVEVRPEFDLPSYSGLSVKRPMREVSEADIDSYLDRYLAQYESQTSSDEPAGPTDSLALTFEFTHNGVPIRKIRAGAVRQKAVVRFQDGELSGFDTLMSGVKTGDVRHSEIVVSIEAERVELRGEKLAVTITVNDVLKNTRPTQDSTFLATIGYETLDDLRTEIRSMLLRQLQFEQRQAARQQVLQHITSASAWDLPEELVRKQVENALRREILEMQQAGYTTSDIRARENELRQNAITTTRQALKEHFVLDRIATREEIETTAVDVESEISMMAIQSGENPRRVRARLTKSGLLENLEAQIRERKAVDFILKSAVYEDVPAPAPADSNVEPLGFSISSADSATVMSDEDDKE